MDNSNSRVVNGYSEIVCSINICGLSQRSHFMLNKYISDKNIAILGLTFKPNTDDMRDSPSLRIIEDLVNAGAIISAYDPSGNKASKNLIKGIKFCENAYATMESASCLVIITEWNEFRALDLERVRSLLKTPIIIDFRNIYEPEEMEFAGFKYVCIGRPR